MAASTPAFSWTMAVTACKSFAGSGSWKMLRPTDRPAPPARTLLLIISKSPRRESIFGPPAMTTGTQQEAINKAAVVLGKPSSNRRWAFRVLEITDARLSESAK